MGTRSKVMELKTNVVWSDGMLSVQPIFPESLLKELGYWRRVTELVGWKKVFTNKREELFVINSYESDTDGGTDGNRLITMDGFMFRVKRGLAKAGYEFTVTDNRTPRPKPDIDLALEGLWEVQKPIVYTALMSGGGVLSCPTGYGKTRMSASIIKAYDRDSLRLRGTPLTVFASPERDINLKNYAELKSLLKDRDVGIMQSGTKHVVTDDVMCVTLDSLDNINPDHVGLFICDEVHTGVSDSRSTSIQDMKFAIKFGVSATPSGRYDGKDLVIEALFGPVVFKKTYQEAVEDGVLVPINVVWVKAPEPDLGLKFYNKIKSRDCKVRHAITSNIGLSKLVGQVMDLIPESMQSITIMPTIEQMNNIRPFANVSVAHGETNADSLKRRNFINVPALSLKSRKELYQDMYDGKVKRVLATHVYKQGVNFPGLEVMINAGGGGGEIAAKQIPGRVSRTVDGKSEAWLIDFWHDWDMVTNRYGKTIPGPIHSDDKKRKKFYTELGFNQVVLNSVSELSSLLTKSANADVLLL